MIINPEKQLLLFRSFDAAGIVFIMSQTEKCTSKVSNCKNSGTITGQWWSSGIAGMSGNREVKTGKDLISSCVNTGTVNGITGVEDMPGILGYNQNTEVKKCVNEGTIKRS